MLRKILRKTLWKFCAGIAVLCGAVALALAVLAPQLFVLWSEGFPEPVWPAKGQFITVQGVSGAKAVAPARPLPDAAQRRFDAAEGRALIVMRGDAVMGATYGGDVGPATLLNSYSLVKTLTGALVLRAVSEGRIASLDQSVQALLGADMPDVSLRQVLLMQSGLVLWGEPPKEGKSAPLDDNQFSPLGPVARLHAFGIERIMPKVKVDPAMQGQFHYQSANTAILGRVVEQAYGAPLDQVLSREIWQKAGAADARWRVNPTSGRVSAYCCLYARALDWARVGRFLLRNGQVAPGDAPFLTQALWRDWVLPELQPEARRAGVYGWHLRHDVLDRDGAAAQGAFAYLMGHGGQVVYLLPDLDAVVVRFGAVPQLLHSTVYELFPGG